MAGTLKSLLVRLGIDSRALDTGLTAAEQKTKQTEKAMASMTAASKRAEAGMALQAQKAAALAEKQKILTDTAKKASVAMLAIATAGTAVIAKSTLLASRVETLGVVVQQVGKTAGYSESQIATFEKGVKKMGITTQAARQALAQMAQAQIDWANASKLARLAQDTAVIANTNSSESFERLTTVVATGNVLMARRLGLNVNFQKSYERMAETIGITVDALDENQRIQARLNEVYRVGVGIAGTYESAMETSGKKMQSLKRYFEEIQVVIGNEFLPVLSAVIDKITSLSKTILNMDPQLRSAIIIFGGIMTVVIGVTGALLGLLAVIPSIVAGLATIGVVVNLATGGILLLVGAIVTVVAAIIAWASADKMKKNATIEAAEETANAAKTYYGYRKALEDAARETGRIVITQEKYNELMSRGGRAAVEAQKAIVLWTDAEWRAVQAQEALAAATKATDTAILEHQRAIVASAGNIIRVYSDEEKAIQSLADYQSGLISLTKSQVEEYNKINYNAARKTLHEYRLGVISLTNEELSAAEATIKLNEELSNTVEIAKPAATTFRTMGISLGSMSIDTDAAIKELQKYLDWLTTEGPGIVAAIQRITNAVETGVWTPELGKLAATGLQTGGVEGMNRAIADAQVMEFIGSGRMDLLSGMTGGAVAPTIAAPTTPAPVEITAIAPDIPGLTAGTPAATEEPEEILKEVNIMEHAEVTIERPWDERDLAAMLARLI